MHSPHWQATLRRVEAEVDRGVAIPAVETGFDEYRPSIPPQPNAFFSVPKPQVTTFEL